MKQIKAFIHRNRVPDVLHALEAASFERVSLFDVKGMLHALHAREREYSVAFGDQVVSEVQVELFCDDPDVARAVEIFRRVGQAGHRDAGWVYVSAVESAWPIGEEESG